jgi:Phage integrase family
MTNIRWVLSKNTWINPNPKLPGVWECKGGGFLIRAETKSPLTGKQKEVRLVLRNVASALEAKQILEDELTAIRQSDRKQVAIELPTFARFVTLYLARRVDQGRIRSEATKEMWAGIIKNHLCDAPFFSYFVDKVQRAHIQKWVDDYVTPLVKNETYSPVTVNTWLDKLRTLWRKAVIEYDLPSNPMTGIEDFDTSTVRTYTMEQPNSLTPEELPTWLSKCWQIKRRYYAEVLLGFLTGLRPSCIRPLRRKGPEADVLWDKSAIIIRQSHTRKQIVMAKAKTRRSHEEQDQVLYLPREIMDVLAEHARSYTTDEQLESDLLFPAENGKLQSHSALQGPFQAICEALKMTKKITPRAMRRTSIDLARLAQLDTKVAMAVSGHKTDRMKFLYSTVGEKEMRESLAKVALLATGSGPSAPPTAPEPGPVKGQRGHLRRVK